VTAVSVTSVSSRILNVGDDLVVRGIASSDLKGKRAQLQRQQGDKWAVLATTGITQKAKFAFKLRILQSGKEQRLRVLVPKSSTTPAAKASAGKITVYGWFYVDDSFPPVSGYFDEGSYEVNGETYAQSVAQTIINGAGPGSVTTEIGLSRDCTTFEATIGMGDTSSSDARWSTSLNADDLNVWQQASLAVGNSYPVSLDVTGALRLKFSSARDTWPNGPLVFGDARLRCAF
jgi:hypothetical protein